MKREKERKSILPAPNMNYDRIHMYMAYIILGLAVLGIWKLIDIIYWFI